jgi:hypothetical protein
MRKRISCPECGKEMNLWACAGISKGTLGNSVLDRVRRDEDGATQYRHIIIPRYNYVFIQTKIPGGTMTA